MVEVKTPESDGDEGHFPQIIGLPMEFSARPEYSWSQQLWVSLIYKWDFTIVIDKNKNKRERKHLQFHSLHFCRSNSFTFIHQRKQVGGPSFRRAVPCPRTNATPITIQTNHFIMSPKTSRPHHWVTYTSSENHSFPKSITLFTNNSQSISFNLNLKTIESRIISPTASDESKKKIFPKLPFHSGFATVDIVRWSQPSQWNCLFHPFEWHLLLMETNDDNICWIFSPFSLIFHDLHDLNPIASQFHDDVENHNSLQFSFNVHCFVSMLFHIITFNFLMWLFSNSSSQNWRTLEYNSRFISRGRKCYSLSVVLFDFGKSWICRLKTLKLHSFLFPTFSSRTCL